MAEYFSPTVVQPAIPIADMTPLERWLLCAMFEHDVAGDALYFFARTGVNEPIAARPADVRSLLSAHEARESRAADIVRLGLAACDPAAEEVDIDLSLDGFEGVFQDIVRRSPTLDHVQIMTSWTCTRMRADGFGGTATFISAEAIETMSTTSFLEAALARLHGDTAVPRLSSHPLFCEPAPRSRSAPPIR